MTLIVEIGDLKMARRILSLLLFLVLISSLGVTLYYIDNSSTQLKVLIQDANKQGIITIINRDADSNSPIAGTVYEIVDIKKNRVIGVITTDESGKGTSEPLRFGKNYMIKQKSVIDPYIKDEKEFNVKLTAERIDLLTFNHLSPFVKQYHKIENEDIKVTEFTIPVETVLQFPELPNGCEITSLTALMNYYGYDITKTDLADEYLPKQPFKRKENKLFGADPYKAYAGNPREKGGFFSFTPPIIEAANKYFDSVGTKMKAIDLSGSSKEKIMEVLNNGNPVITWITLELDKPRFNYSWHLHESGDIFQAPTNLHTVVLMGYENNKVIVMNPLKGKISYDANTFFESYQALGSHAMYISTY